MKRSTKVLLWAIGIFAVIISLGAVFLYSMYTGMFGEAAPDSVVKDYVEEKYGFEIDMIEERSIEGIGGPTEYIVSPEKDENVKFKVTVDAFDHTIIKDDYAFALEADQENDKLKKVIPAIKELGFSGGENADIHVTYIEESVYLYLSSDEQVRFEEFAEEELDRFYELYLLVKESQAAITNVSVGNTNFMTSVSFYLEPAAPVKTEEEFLQYLKSNHMEIINQELESMLATDVKSIENDRFHFGNQYDDTHDNPYDSWFHCTEVNEEAECTAAVLSVTYQKDGLTLTNSHLEGDLSSIFNFIAEHLEPKTKIEFIYFKEDNLSTVSLDIGYEERMEYEDISELITFLLGE